MYSIPWTHEILSLSINCYAPMSPRRALEVQHLKYPSFLLELHFQKDISIEKGIRSKVKCRSSAHFPSIWACTPGSGWGPVAMRRKRFQGFKLHIVDKGLSVFTLGIHRRQSASKSECPRS